MEFNVFVNFLGDLVKMAMFEEKLDAISADYPALGSVAARILEYSVTGLPAAHSAICWWLYELNCGESAGTLFLHDGSQFTVKTSQDLYDLLHNKEVYEEMFYPEYEQMEIV